MMYSPCTALLPNSATKEIPIAIMIRVSLQEEGSSKSSVTIEINPEASIQNLISAYCAKVGIGYNSKFVILDGKGNSLPNFRSLQSLGITRGQQLYVGYEKKTSIADKKWVFLLTIIIIAVFILAIIIMAAVYATSGGTIPFDFGIVMDAGSSKTNVLLYKWAGDKEKGTGCVRQANFCNVKGGIDKARNVSYVLPCLGTVTKSIKPSSVSSTPVYFAATAGMRLLNVSDPAKAKDVLNSVTVMLNDTGMVVKAVEIITGKDEGLYDWITANFLSETLEKPLQTEPWNPTTVGALDMGGASAQIAFALEPSNTTEPDVQKMELYGQTHDVFSRSNLCFGRGEAENRHRALLVKDPKDIGRVLDPCSPKDYRFNMTGGKLFDQPCTQNEKFKRWLKDDPELKNRNVSFIGSGNFSGCSEAMQRLVNTTTCEGAKFQKCFQKFDKPIQGHKFLAFATYFYTTDALELVKSTLDEYISGTMSYCNKTNEDMGENPYAATYCFNACYIYEMLINGYGFTNSTWSDITFIGEIDEKEISWPLGYMIKATNIIPAKSTSPRFTTVGVFAVCMVIFVSVVIAAAAFLAYNFGRKNSRQSSQQLFLSV